jgi:hypothetical protein
MEQEPDIRAGDSQPEGGRGFDRAQNQRPENLGLAAAIAVCEKALGHGGAESGAEVEDGAKRDHQIAALKDWATENDLWVPHRVPDELKDADTREHLLFHRDEEPDRIFKITKGPGFGVFPARLIHVSGRRPVRYWFADRAATPLEYLRRLWLSNLKMMSHLDREAFPVLTRLEGVVMSQDDFRIVTSQPIFDGKNAEVNDTADWFRSLGFEFIKAYTWFRPDDGLAVFDTWGDNVMICNGQVVPFDVIPIHAEGPLLDALTAAVRRVKRC